MPGEVENLQDSATEYKIYIWLTVHIFQIISHRAIVTITILTIKVGQGQETLQPSWQISPGGCAVPAWLIVSACRGARCCLPLSAGVPRSPDLNMAALTDPVCKSRLDGLIEMSLRRAPLHCFTPAGFLHVATSQISRSDT